MTTPRRIAVVAALVLTMSLAGCGLGAGSTPSGVQLTVTSDFGANTIRAWDAPRATGEETVLSLLMRNASVGTSDGGGFVQTIDGRAGGQLGREPIGWFYFVNGMQAAKGAAETNVHSGDRIWWDLHSWGQSQESPAVVGSFPAPFTTGPQAGRAPVLVECAPAGSPPCRTVAARLRALGVPAGVGAVDSRAQPHALRVLVGPWQAIRAAGYLNTIERGPRASGVYARFSFGGGALAVLDARGRTAVRLGAGAGLVAATRHGDDAPVWVVSGTDAAGVQRAASAFDAGDLRNRFALAVTAGGAGLSVPAAPAASAGAHA